MLLLRFMEPEACEATGTMWLSLPEERKFTREFKSAFKCRLTTGNETFGRKLCLVGGGPPAMVKLKPMLASFECPTPPTTLACPLS